ncbi:ImmA/IrrE family metallo-endopeptidase [Epidermidibacterium keratini]|uniref:ImmA/IrrE family metallo-endopeptidase n=1 Tax=Epidermidibacterium keratini TaxID=1891644 RepID=A0A7L4YJW6_9ACTN|nr:ImmA/IrrE family metallo-endopeptidase [Epidermidibacterium keratini]QHB99560.1 ImmA/IrrE family metallo-endopeptidase [Epidermidibacterium keratini]
MNQTHHHPSTLRRLRSVIPATRSDVSFAEALRTAELQAALLHECLDHGDGITEAAIANLPRIRIARETLASVGSSHWNGREWVICLNAQDPLTRQRFTLLHELKHIIDHGNSRVLYRGDMYRTREVQAEVAADYFAGCALVPKRELKRAWGNGLQRPEQLAEHFGVSIQAIEVRLDQTGLSRVVDHVLAPRCARPIYTPRGYRQRFRTALRYPARSPA